MDDASEEKKDKITLHFAKMVIDDNAFIYKPSVFNLLEQHVIVRISFTADTDYAWSFDSPYIEIIKVVKANKTNEYEYMGKVADISRIKSNKYPLNIGEKIWFSRENIIEIPSEYNADIKLKSHLTKDKVQCTGPLFTIESDDDSDYSDSSMPSLASAPRSISDESD